MPFKTSAEAIGPLDYALQKELEEYRDSRAQVVLLGDLPDYAAYRYQCGEIRGIQMAIDCLVALRERLGDER